MKNPNDLNDPDDPNNLSDLSETDEALFMRWRQNHDEAAFQTIDKRYRPRLLALVDRTIKRNQASAAALACDAEDIVQDVFTALNNCPDPVGSVRAVLYQAVQSHLLDLIRASKAKKRDYRKTVHSDEMSYHVTDPSAEPAVRDAKIELHEAMAKLPPTEEQAVRLELDGHTHASAAEAANVRQSTFWSRLRSGRKRLKEILTPPLILLAVVGAVADDCDIDVYMNLCTAETDEDEVSREDSGHHESDRHRRKSLMRLPIWPVAAKEMKCRLALDKVHPSIRKRSEEGTLTVSPPPSPDRSWLEHEENGRVLRLRASQATRRRSPVPSVLQAA